MRNAGRLGLLPASDHFSVEPTPATDLRRAPGTFPDVSSFFGPIVEGSCGGWTCLVTVIIFLNISVGAGPCFSTRLKPVLGGDVNGEVGAGKDKSWKHVLGPIGHRRRTQDGEELLSVCEQEGLVVFCIFTQQSCKATWFHKRRGMARALDYFVA